MCYMSLRVCTVVSVAKESFSFRFDPLLIEAVDVARGDVSRTRFIERAIEGSLERLNPPRAGERPESDFQNPVPAIVRATRAAPKTVDPLKARLDRFK